MGTDANTNASEGQTVQQPPVQQSAQQPPKLSPVEIPEILSLIVSYLSIPTLGVAAQVSFSFHAACTPHLWRYISLDDETAEEIWKSHKGFRMGMIRYGRYVEEFELVGTSVQDGDLELMGENFTRLRKLNLSGTNVTEETLRVLIHSDPYGTQPGSVKAKATAGVKRKAGVKNGRGSAAKRRVGGNKASAVDDDEEEEEEEENAEEEVGDGLDEIEKDLAVNAETKMQKYREYTETETEYEADSQYESIGILNPSSTATESEQDRPTGSIPHGSAAAATKIRVKGRLAAGKIPLHRLSGTTRPAKFKGTKTQFPFYLEELVLNRCNNLTGPSALKLIGRLGPQLKKLCLNHISDLKDSDLLAFMKHVPHLVEIAVKGTDITDALLKGLTKLTTPTTNAAGSASGTGRAGLEGFNFDMTNITPDGLIPLITANRSTLRTASFEHNHQATDAVLYAFIESPSTSKSGPSTKETGAPTVPPRVFSATCVLTTFLASYCTSLTDAGLAILFKAATELMYVGLDGTSVGDESLLALAEAYRIRMKDIGLGVPAAWREHELAEDEVLIAAHAKIPSEAGAAALARKTNGFDHSLEKPKVYAGYTVPGGLRRLSLKHCPKISNRGLRAVLRSCVNLQGLNVSNCGRLSVEIFNGPWAVRQLNTLMIVGMPLQLAPEATGYETLLKEEEAEKQRFPPVLEEFPAKYEFDHHGQYDYIVVPTDGRSGVRGGGMGSSMGGFGGWNDDEDEEGDDEELVDDAAIMDAIRAAMAAAEARYRLKAKKSTPTSKAESFRYKFPSGKTKTLKLPPPDQRNTNTQRALLKQFYTKLGTFTQLCFFDMSQCMFRIRPKDGLELALPGLTKSLETWNMYRPAGCPDGYPLQDSDLEFFGRYFGYGRTNCPISMEKLDIIEQEQRHAAEKAKKAAKAKADKAKKAAKAKAAKGKKIQVEEEDEDEDKKDDEGKGEGELQRVSKLNEWIVNKFATEGELDSDVYEWFLDQDVDLVQIDDFDYDMMR
ncbi:MAG: hypothetical protein J3R72DRAFT_495655 [Linnemannia gamsii]|nr:MAG: hypothetical protein J3R72DRAFT_495655 [Linnemannia gamsii]